VKILTSIGLVLVVFSLIWLFVIFPFMAKLPADHHKVVNLEGTYKVMNPQTQILDAIPINVEREQRATEVQDNVLIINQTVTTTHALAGMELPQFGLNEILGVDRSTREYVPGYGDMDRSGQFCFPAEVEEESYSVWMPSAGRPLEANFTGEEDLEGLRVFTFKISEQGLDIGTQQGTGLPQVLDIVVDMKVEPVSGTTVYSKSLNTIKVVPAAGMEMTVYDSNLTFTDDTIADLIDTAKSARTLILWATVYGFWLVIGVGIVLTLVGVIGIVRAR
jgi:sporulation protein YlmC with PRC-barrel domain